MAHETAGDHELTDARDARVRQQQIEQREVALCHLRLARRALIGAADAGTETDALNRVIAATNDELEALVISAGGYILSRKRPRKKSDETCTVYIDECGQHSIAAKDKFEAFSLAAVVIRDSEAQQVDETWKIWKATWLGSAEKLVHEPDVRWGRGSFFFNHDEARREAAVRALSALIPSLNFTGIVCVINRPQYRALYGEQPLDDSLPAHPYLMTLDFVLERAVMALQEKFGGAK